jgi:hypothetical protein
VTAEPIPACPNCPPGYDCESGNYSFDDFEEIRDEQAARLAEVSPVSRALFDEDPAAYDPHGMSADLAAGTEPWTVPVDHAYVGTGPKCAQCTRSRALHSLAAETEVFNPAYRVARCGQQSAHGPHVVDHGPDQPRNCPGTCANFRSPDANGPGYPCEGAEMGVCGGGPVHDEACPSSQEAHR